MPDVPVSSSILSKEADLIVVHSNPLDDLAVLRSTANVFMLWKGSERIVDRGEDRAQIKRALN